MPDCRSPRCGSITLLLTPDLYGAAAIEKAAARPPHSKKGANGCGWVPLRRTSGLRELVARLDRFARGDRARLGRLHPTTPRRIRERMCRRKECTLRCGGAFAAGLANRR